MRQEGRVSDSHSRQHGKCKTFLFPHKMNRYLMLYSILQNVHRSWSLCESMYVGLCHMCAHVCTCMPLYVRKRATQCLPKHSPLYFLSVIIMCVHSQTIVYSRANVRVWRSGNVKLALSFTFMGFRGSNSGHQAQDKSASTRGTFSPLSHYRRTHWLD